MKKGLFLVTCATLLCNVFCIPGHCENMMTYSDDYVSFEYDADVVGAIDFIDSKAGISFAAYSVHTAMKKDDYDVMPSAKICIGDSLGTILLRHLKDDVAEYYNSDSENDSYSIKCIGENEICAIPKHDDLRMYYEKLLYADDVTYISVSYYEMDGYTEQVEFVKHIYDTTTVSATYGVGSYDTSKKDYFHKTIFCNTIITEQAINYANEAIRIIKSYLSFEMDAETAKEEVANLYTRIENYVVQSEYIHDDDIRAALSLIEYDFDGKSDMKLVDTVEELEMLCGLEDE